MADVSHFACKNGLAFQRLDQAFYHRPCHDSLQGEAERLFSNHGAGQVPLSYHCCAEAGTLALSRPDIAAAMRTRKAESLGALSGANGRVKTVLTNCPSCIQGLGRHPVLPVKARHLAVELAIGTGGASWEKELREWVVNAEAITF